MRNPLNPNDQQRTGRTFSPASLLRLLFNLGLWLQLLPFPQGNQHRSVCTLGAKGRVPKGRGRWRQAWLRRCAGPAPPLRRSVFHATIYDEGAGGGGGLPQTCRTPSSTLSEPSEETGGHAGASHPWARTAGPADRPRGGSGTCLFPPLQSRDGDTVNCASAFKQSEVLSHATAG